MKNLRNLTILLLLLPALSFSSGDSGHITSIDIDISDRSALQKGAKYYTNYCMSCHALSFSSYKKIQKDLRLTETQVLANLVMSYGDEKKLSDYMTTSLSAKQGKDLFGKVPPDLSTISRAKPEGVNWLYSYLTSFYVDANRPYGMNNLVFKDVGMPHVMLELQGYQIVDKTKDVNGQQVVISIKADPTRKGRLSTAEYKQAVKELVTFLAYVGEPTKESRHKLGVWVLLFLFIFTILAYMLKKEYWRDIH